MTHKYPKSIAAAARLLDQVKPSWANKIDLNKLSMECDDTCILGQLYSTYVDGISELFGECGVNSYDSIFGIKASLSTWKKEIKKRLVNKEDQVYKLKFTKHGNMYKPADKHTKDILDQLCNEVSYSKIKIFGKFKWCGVVYTKLYDGYIHDQKGRVTRVYSTNDLKVEKVKE